MTRSALLIEDDPDIRNLIALHLKELNLWVEFASDGESGLKKSHEKAYDIIILDLMLPKLDGYEVCRRIRATDSKVPIIILSIKSGLVDKVVGLELGADDYLTKPFSVDELKARVKARLRASDTASEKDSSDVIEIGALVIDPSRRSVSSRGTKIDLTAKQFDLLHFLAKSPGRIYTRSDLLQYVWDYDASGYDHTIDTHVNRLRGKIEKNPSKPSYLLTVWGVGYRFAEPHELKKEAN